MDKKHIEKRVAVKGLINGFIAYGVLLLFIFFSLVVLVSWFLNNHQDSLNYDVLKYTLPVVASLLAFFLMRIVCRLSTYDLFKKCKVDKKDVDSISSKMTMFFIGCIIISVILVIAILNVRFYNETIDIQETSTTYYSEFTDSFADYLTNELINDFKTEKPIVIIQAIIIEIGIFFGLISLISIQKNLIERYNTVENTDNNDEENLENKKIEKRAES